DIPLSARGRNEPAGAIQLSVCPPPAAGETAMREQPSPADLLAAYGEVRGLTVELCRPLTPEDMLVQSMPQASPAKWHLAHTTWFFETFVLAGRPGHRPFHPQFAYLFNSYYNAVGDRIARPRRGLLSRPGAGEVLRYRGHVDAAVRRLLSGPEV